MKTINFLSLLAIVIVLSALTTALRSAQEPADANPGHITPEHQAKAKEIYSIDCAMCHGTDGRGKTDLNTSMNLALKDWTDPATFGSKTDKQLFNIIRNGSEKMPPEATGRASDEVVWNIVHYVRNLASK